MTFPFHGPPFGSVTPHHVIVCHGPVRVQVNLKLFTPAPNKRRTVLLFVFRDRTRTPLPRLVETWEADLAQMWAGITKPPQYEASSLTDFFEARVCCHARDILLSLLTGRQTSSLHFAVHQAVAPDS